MGLFVFMEIWFFCLRTVFSLVNEKNFYFKETRYMRKTVFFMKYDVTRSFQGVY